MLLQELLPAPPTTTAEALEIFDAAPPYRPNGAVAQAWSVAELLRVLKKMQRAAPGVYRRWEAHLREETM